MFHGPITAITFLDDSDAVLYGTGTELHLHDGSRWQSWPCLAKDRLHGITALSRSPDCWHLLLSGGRQLVLAQLSLQSQSFTIIKRHFLPDRILSTAFYQQTHVLVCTAHNTVWLLDLANLNFVKQVDCIEQPLLWSARFSSSDYDSLDDVLLACGAILQEVLVWRPFVSVQIERRFVGHQVGRSAKAFLA
jgi:hypothetical protein